MDDKFLIKGDGRDRLHLPLFLHTANPYIRNLHTYPPILSYHASDIKGDFACSRCSAILRSHPVT